jgi:Kef-type K+ transport system membrane component KefB
MLLASAPLVTNPVAIFLIVLVIILMAPVLLTRLKIPHIIGMIVAGLIVGPYGFNILANDSSFQIFGQVGLLYLMFLAGIEIDMYHLRLNLKRGLIFGVLTFIVPMIIGAVASVYVLKLDWLTATLLASMYASHTLISYPIVARMGITRAPAVLISIVGTIIAVIGALLVLACTVNINAVGQFEITEILLLLGKLTLYCAVVLYVYPRLTRWFFKSYADNVTQYVFILALVFASALVAKFIGLEAVLGSFFAGLVLNRYIPVSSPLMTRIEFVGNALFIPYFLIGVGMMININVIGNPQTLLVTAVMLAIALISKWLAAYIAQKIYRMDGNDRRMMFGLTTAHTAVALAVVTIGYNMVDAAGNHMMDETILNGTVLVILITCAIAPIVTSSAASRLKIRMLEQGGEEPNDKRQPIHTLIPIDNPITSQSLVELALLMRPQRRSDVDSLYALHVRNDNSSSSKAMSKNVMQQASQAAASANYILNPIERYDLNTVTGILNTIEERDINEVFIGMHRKATVIDSFYGSKIDQLLKLTRHMVVISRCFIPVNTVTRIVVYVPPKAQFESGFTRWVHALANLARELGCRIIFCCPQEIQRIIRMLFRRDHIVIRSEYRVIEDRDDFLLLANHILDDDLFVVVGARAGSVSYSADVAEFQSFLQRHFSRNNIVIIIPEQASDIPVMESFGDPMAADVTSTPSPWMVRLRAFWQDHSPLRRRRHRRRDIDL